MSCLVTKRKIPHSLLLALSQESIENRLNRVIRDPRLYDYRAFQLDGGVGGMKRRPATPARDAGGECPSQLRVTHWRIWQSLVIHGRSFGRYTDSLAWINTLSLLPYYFYFLRFDCNTFGISSRIFYAFLTVECCYLMQISWDWCLYIL